MLIDCEGWGYKKSFIGIGIRSGRGIFMGKAGHSFFRDLCISRINLFIQHSSLCEP